MKKKQLNILLAFSILFIWGYIIREVFVSSELEKEDINHIVNKTGKQKQDTTARYKLLAIYSDPFKVKNYFGNNRFKVNHNSKTKSLSRKRKAPKRVAKRIMWPKIQFKGRIKNHTTEENIAILKVNGKGYRLPEHETIENIEINTVWKDSMLVVFEGEQRVFEIE